MAFAHLGGLRGVWRGRSMASAEKSGWTGRRGLIKGRLTCCGPGAGRRVEKSSGLGAGRPEARGLWIPSARPRGLGEGHRVWGKGEGSSCPSGGIWRDVSELMSLGLGQGGTPACTWVGGLVQAGGHIEEEERISHPSITVTFLAKLVEAGASDGRSLLENRPGLLFLWRGGRVAWWKGAAGRDLGSGSALLLPVP